jgi:hypothetical protein
MMFGQGGIDGESIFKLVDLLQREKKLPGDATPWMWRVSKCATSLFPDIFQWVTFPVVYQTLHA